MMLKQGSEYVDSSQVPEAQTGGSGKKPPLPILIGGAVAIVLIILVALIFLTKKGKEPADTPADQPGTDAEMGDSNYWSQFDVPDVFSYSAEELAQLRAWGYTGDEIEAFAKDETPAANLIAASKASQEEARQTLSNPESPEYKALLDNTWLGQQPLTLPAYTMDTTEASIVYNAYVYNADYEKIPAHGHNLYLKVYLEDGSYAFMECPLLRYMQLADQGNIVVQYQTAVLEGMTIVYAMQEVTVQ